jgi:hypothetical protein
MRGKPMVEVLVELVLEVVALVALELRIISTSRVLVVELERLEAC